MLYKDAIDPTGMTLGDLLYKQKNGTTAEKTYYSNFGVDKVVFPDRKPLLLVSRLYFTEDVTVEGSFSLMIMNDLGETVTVTVWDKSKASSSEFNIPAGSVESSVWSPNGGHIEYLEHETTITWGGTSATGAPFVQALWPRVVTRVNEQYWDRMLGSETLERWQVRLQVLVDRHVNTWERRLRMYAAAGTSLEDPLASQTTTYDTTDQSSGSSRSRFSDTPDTAINENQNYAGSVTDGTSGNTATKKGSVTTEVKGSGGLLESINQNVDAWRDVETEIVDAFDRCFMHTAWY